MRFDEKVGFKVSSGIKAFLLNLEQYPFHVHDNVLELLCVLEGSIKGFDGALAYTLSLGDVFISSPMHPHKYISDEDNIVLIVQIDLSYYNNCFNNMNLIEEMDLVCNSFQQGNRHSQDVKYLRFLMAKMFREYSVKNPSELRLEEQAREMIRFLLDHFKYFYYTKSVDGSYWRLQGKAQNDTEQCRMYEILQTINCKYMQKLTLDELANQYYLSSAYLSRFIKKNSGLTFSELLSLRRCEEAGRKLSMTDETIDQISSEVGFSGRNNLSKQFQKWYGKTPTEYRKEVREDLRANIDLRAKTYELEKGLAVIERFLEAY